jgi:uncharacterized protein YjiS (DUF1127 family)
MNMLNTITAFWRRRALARSTARALARCSDRTLADLGLERADIGRIARLAASAPSGTPLAVLTAALEPRRTTIEQAGVLVSALRARIAGFERPEPAFVPELAR